MEPVLVRLYPKFLSLFIDIGKWLKIKLIAYILGIAVIFSMGLAAHQLSITDSQMGLQE